ncbi:MAG: WD40 repeat domain-containing protein, partial [Lentisphaeria bacterium]|nr:WD40 repeat domain-containing protein [Lentisphaeria bacterium]
NLSKDRAAKLWEISTGKLVRKFEGHTVGLNACSFSPDGRLLATASSDDTVRVWEVSSGRCLRTYREHDGYVVCARISPDGRYVASAGGDGVIRLWDIASGETVRTMTGHEEVIQGLEFSPDGRYLASASRDKTVRLWEVATGKCPFVGREHVKAAGSLAFSADGKTLVSGGWDGLLCIRSVPSGEVVASAMVLDEERIVVFTPSGEYTGPAGVEQFVSVERDNRLLTAREIDASLHRDRDVVAALSQIRPSQSTAVHRTPEKRQREADSPPEEPSSLSARDIKPLFGTWVHPFGLRVPELWAKEVWNEDGTGAIYDAVDHTVPMDRFTFEVKKKHPDQPIYHVVIRYNPGLAFYVSIRTSPDGRYKESECYGPNVPHFPASFNPGQETYSVLYRQPAAAPSNEPLVGTWVDPRGAFSRGMLGKIVFRKDNSGTIFDLVTDLVPADVFKYEVVWKDPRSPSYLVIVTYRPDNFWYLFVKLGKQGRLLETDSFGQCRMMYPPGINQRSRFWFSGEKQ